MFPHSRDSCSTLLHRPLKQQASRLSDAGRYIFDPIGTLFFSQNPFGCLAVAEAFTIYQKVHVMTAPTQERTAPAQGPPSADCQIEKNECPTCLWCLRLAVLHYVASEEGSRVSHLGGAREPDLLTHETYMMHHCD